MDKQQQLDQLFRLAQQDPMIQSFDQTKDRFKASLNNPAVNKTRTKQVFTKKWMIMLTTLSVITLAVMFLLNGGENQPSGIQSGNRKIEQVTRETKTAGSRKVLLDQQETSTSVRVNQSPKSVLTGIPEFVSEVPSTGGNTESGRHLSAPVTQSISYKPFEEPVQFPVLTAEEIAITGKKKKSMLKALSKRDKNAYSFIPSGSFNYNGDTISVQAFYMGTCEVTNFEYRTFLFDLLIQNRKDEFLKAKPNQSAWLDFPAGGYPDYKDLYFSDKKYNEYPVVNISREGAELYCRWLSQEVRKFVGADKEGKYNDVRLPLRAEWVKAASNEGKQLPYPWGGPFRRNSNGSFLANFTHDIEIDQIDTTGFYKLKFSHSDVIAPAKSYWPNALWLYNMSGNVAEMVYEGMNRTEPGTAGGSWKSKGDDVRIYASDPYKGVTEPKPMIGFRVVSTYLINSEKDILK